MARKLFIIFLFFALSSGNIFAQEPDDDKVMFTEEIIDGDTILVVRVEPIDILPRKRDVRKFHRLAYNMKVVYPIAKEAGAYFAEMEEALSKMTTDKERDEYTKRMEKMLVRKYTPILENLTFSQGKLLLKLIDRETSKTSYEIVKEFRGGFAAGFWNMIARIFKANLKSEYDKEGEDRMLELLINMYETGRL